MTQNYTADLLLTTHNPDHTCSCKLIVTYIFPNSRPPKGMAGYIDWILDGHISSLILKGKVKGIFCESLLLVTEPKLKASLALVIGVGDPLKLEAKKVRIMGHFTGKIINDLKVSNFGLYPHDLFLPSLDIFCVLNELLEGIKGAVSDKTGICVLSKSREQKDIIARWLQQNNYEKHNIFRCAW